MHTRRTLMAIGAAGLASSCATARGFGGGLMRDLRMAPGTRPVRLPPVLVSEDRIIRVDVGLRPYRPSGFRVEREALGNKVLVHNYGHGGGGITLSWGTAKMAVDLGYDTSKPDVAVLGCGAVGLATARLLQERGANVRIYAKDLPPNTTSNVAGAQWWPSSTFDDETATPEIRQRQFEAARFAFRRYQSLVGDAYGVSWEINYSLSNNPNSTYPAGPDDPMHALIVNLRSLAPDEHNFPSPFVRQFDTMMIETPLYLRRMELDVRQAGGEIHVREFADISQVQALPEQTIFNCTGLGAGRLFGDTEIEPVRGQLAILLPQPEIDYNVIGRGYMFGRRDGIVLGGTFEHGNWSLEPDAQTTANILDRHRAIFDPMRA
ncbi:MAG: FAD-dependent oxidoreductase [Caulobacteraceae bacterium]|nr:FAD-dependent oxidoreductase [Caulobacteraceae bacterium]